MASDTQDQPGSRVRDVAPAPVRSFETFPTPEELMTQRLTVAGIEYVEEHCGVTPGTTGWQALIDTRAVYAVRNLVVALANQYEIQHGLPLRWPPEHVLGLEVVEWNDYLTAAGAALGVTPPPTSDGGAAAGVPRPTRSPGNRKAGRQPRNPDAAPKTDSTGAPSPTV